MCFKIWQYWHQSKWLQINSIPTNLWYYVALAACNFNQSGFSLPCTHSIIILLGRYFQYSIQINERQLAPNISRNEGCIKMHWQKHWIIWAQQSLRYNTLYTAHTWYIVLFLLKLALWVSLSVSVNVSIPLGEKGGSDPVEELKYCKYKLYGYNSLLGTGVNVDMGMGVNRNVS